MASRPQRLTRCINKMTTLDRYIFRGLLVNYTIALAVMISLYVVLDMFFNMDEFTEGGGTVGLLLKSLSSFYGYRVFLYFGQLSGVITLFACLITLARLRRQNELTAMIASGVSLYRVAAPVLVFGLLTNALWYLDAEMIIPSVAHKLARRHDDALGQVTYRVRFLPDREGALLSAQQFLPTDDVLRNLLVITRLPDGTIDGAVEADLATWESTPGGEARGRWVLQRGLYRHRPKRSDAGIGPGEQAIGEPIQYYPSDLDPHTVELRQSAGWVKFLSSDRLSVLADQVEGRVRKQIMHTRHARFTTPLINLLMLCLGVPFILHRMPGNILASAGKTLLVCGACFLTSFISSSLIVGAAGSALPAWLPVLIFTPVAVILVDRMKT